MLDFFIEPGCEILEQSVLTHVYVVSEWVFFYELVVFALSPHLIDLLQVGVVLDLLLIIIERNFLNEQDARSKQVLFFLIIGCLVLLLNPCFHQIN